MKLNDITLTQYLQKCQRKSNTFWYKQKSLRQKQAKLKARIAKAEALEHNVKELQIKRPKGYLSNVPVLWCKSCRCTNISNPWNSTCGTNPLRSARFSPGSRWWNKHAKINTWKKLLAETETSEQLAEEIIQKISKTRSRAVRDGRGQEVPPARKSEGPNALRLNPMTSGAAPMQMG